MRILHSGSKAELKGFLFLGLVSAGMSAKLACHVDLFEGQIFLAQRCEAKTKRGGRMNP